VELFFDKKCSLLLAFCLFIAYITCGELKVDSKLVEKYRSVLEEVFKDYQEAHPEDNIDFEGFIRMITFNLSQEELQILNGDSNAKRS